MRDEPPFPREKVRKHESKGVHTPHPLRDDPNHPHSSLGPDHRKSNFADGGVIGESEFEPEPEFAFGGSIGGAIKNAYGKIRARQAQQVPNATTGFLGKGQAIGQSRGLASLVRKARQRIAPPPSLNVAGPVQPNVGNLPDLGGNLGGFSTPEFKDGGKVKGKKTRYPNHK